MSPEDSARARDRLTAMGVDLSFVFRYTDYSRMANTFRAHRPIHWAGRAQGQEMAMKTALFMAYFTDRRDVGDPKVLADLRRRGRGSTAIPPF